jgi:hypothetical protein
MTETWFVMEDGAVAHPRDVKRDASGVLRHKDGRAVAMRGGVPRSRSVDANEEAAKATPKPAEKPVTETRELTPETPRRTYKTRESKAD